MQGPRPSVGGGGATRHKLPESSPREVTWATLNSVSFELCLTSSIRRARWRPRIQGFPWGLVTWVAFSGTYPALGLGEAKGYSARALVCTAGAQHEALFPVLGVMAPP